MWVCKFGQEEKSHEAGSKSEVNVIEICSKSPAGLIRAT